MRPSSFAEASTATPVSFAKSSAVQRPSQLWLLSVCSTSSSLVPPFDWKPEGKPTTEHSCRAIAPPLTGGGKSISHVFGTPECDPEPWVTERSGTDEVGAHLRRC
jgi:hypothetical protein